MISRLKTSFFILILVCLSSCYKGIKVDLLVHNALIHSMDNSNTVFQAMAIQDGKIIEMGPERQILNRYRANLEIDALGKNIYPGFTDAHTNLLHLAQKRLSANLEEARTLEQILVILEKYHSRNSADFIIGTGLFLGNDEQRNTLANALSNAFKTTPVFIFSKDMQTAILNQKAKEYLSLDKTILCDQELFEIRTYFPKFPKEKIREQLFEIQEEMLQYGIVAIHEMGWSNADYYFFSEIIKDKKWLLDVNAYLLPSEENKKLLQNGIIQKEKLQIQGFQLIMDGTFGNKSAFASTANGTIGASFYSETALDSILHYAYNHKLQMAIQCNGDKSAEFVLKRIQHLGLNVNNLNWRMEHLQKINPVVLQLMAALNLIPSVQPYQIVSNTFVDNGFFAYQSLYNTNQMFAIGSSSAVGTFNPYEIIYAAATGKNAGNTSNAKINTSELLSDAQLLRGYTTFNAFLVNKSHLYGRLTENSFATFFIANLPITTDAKSVYNYAQKTFIKSKEVYSLE